MAACFFSFVSKNISKIKRRRCSGEISLFLSALQASCWPKNKVGLEGAGLLYPWPASDSLGGSLGPWP